MVACCFKKLAGLLLSWVCTLNGVENLSTEDLAISSLPNGVQIWLKQHAAPSQEISCRIVAKNPLQEVPDIFPMNCPVEHFEEALPQLMEYFSESLPTEVQYKLAVIAVGDFEKEQLREFLTKAFERLAPRELQTNIPIVSVSPSEESDMVDVKLAYPSSLQELKTDQDLKKLWVLYLMQSIAEERWRKAASEVKGQWVQPAAARYLFPYSHNTARGKQPINQEPMLIAFLRTVQEFKAKGFTEQELSDAKAKLQKHLTSFYQQNPTNEILADYIASNFVLGAGCPSYKSFMALSLSLLSEIERKDVAALLENSFKDDTRFVDMRVPGNVSISETSIREVLQNYKADGQILNLDGNSQGGAAQGDTYAQLPISETESRIIYEIIDTVGTCGLIKLGWSKSGELEEKGIKVQHVHPFKFLETIFTNNHLKKCAAEIFSDYFKRDGFMNGHGKTPGFAHKMDREDKRNNLLPYVNGFAKVVKVHPDQIRLLIEKKKWDDLVRFLIKVGD